MTTQRLRFGILLSLILVVEPQCGYGASMSDREREKRWADQVVDFIVVGEPVWLNASGVKFLSLYTRPENASTGPARGVILMHGRGVHPAWGFIDSLRIDLAEIGWHTLSIQMPILDTNANSADYGRTFPEAFERIEAAIEYLKERGVLRISLLGHSLGATMGLAYLSAQRHGPVSGLIAIGPGRAENGGTYMKPAEMLTKINKPILDIFGSEDLPMVLNYADTRQEAARTAGNKTYTQIREQGADHFFTDRYDALQEHVSQWLARTVAE